MTAQEDHPAPRQGGLFGPPDPPRSGAPSVAPAPVDPAVEQVAAQLHNKLRIGTSSWAFEGWRGLVYAAGAAKRHLSKHGLSAYSQHPLLRTVGIDRTFYAPIPASTFAEYADQVPGSFRFLVKAWEEVTNPRLRDRTGLNPNFLDADCATDRCVAPAVDGLGAKLGPLLLQFPPQGDDTTARPDAFADRLHDFLTGLPRGPRYVVELRDAALFTPRYAAALRAAGASHGYVVHPRMPSLGQQSTVARAEGPVTVRWMLRRGLSYQQAKQRYEPFNALLDHDVEARDDITAMALDAAARDEEINVVVNNKAEGSSPLSVLELARRIVQASADVNARSTSAS